MADKLILKVKRFDINLPLPIRHTSGAACFDLYARLDTEIASKSFGKIPLNVAVELPQGHWAVLAARSSTHMLGLIPANGIGIIDEDYCGEEDEYQFLAYNVTALPIMVRRGTRIAQMLVLPSIPIQIHEITELGQPSRGGFGSTGHG